MNKSEIQLVQEVEGEVRFMKKCCQNLTNSMKYSKMESKKGRHLLKTKKEGVLMSNQALHLEILFLCTTRSLDLNYEGIEVNQFSRKVENF